MTLPTSPPITMAQIRTEFGAPAGTPLHQFYQGGPWVGTGGANANVPTSAPINMLNLLGAASGGTTNTYYVSVSPTSVSGKGAQGLVYTNVVTASPHNGTGNASATWSQVSGDSGIHITAPGSASTQFSGNVTGGNALSGVFVCTMKDVGGTGNTAQSPPVPVNIVSTSRV